MGSRKEELKKEKMVDDMRRDIRHVCINDNVYKISETDAQKYDSQVNAEYGIHEDEELEKWIEFIIKKYKPLFYLEIIVRND